MIEKELKKPLKRKRKKLRKKKKRILIFANRCRDLSSEIKSKKKKIYNLEAEIDRMEGSTDDIYIAFGLAFKRRSLRIDRDEIKKRLDKLEKKWKRLILKIKSKKRVITELRTKIE